MRPRLIAITAPQERGWEAVESAAARALEAGLPALMLRDPAAEDETLMPIARRLRALTTAHGGLLIVNRRLALAAEVRADGIHLGATGPAIAEARAALGEEVLIGYSAHAVQEALDALARGADYVTFSPIWPTPSKAGILAPRGLAALAELARRAPGRVIALGGISLENVSDALKAGAAGVAVIRAIFAAADPARATRDFMKRLPPTE